MREAEVLVVGAGVAGLSAALTLGSEGRKVILLERLDHAGGQAATSSLIENFPAHPNGFSGADFQRDFCEHCRKFGVQIEYECEVRGIIPACDSYTLDTNHGMFTGRVILLAMGLMNKRLDVPGSNLPQVHHGMDVNALEDIGGRRVALIGGGNSAGQAAAFYLNHGASVSLVVRRPIAQTMSKYLVDRIAPHVDVIEGSVVAFQQENDNVSILLPGSVVNKYADINRSTVDCVHVFIGLSPATDWLRGYVQLDGSGYIPVDHEQRTNRPGIYAVGDVVSGAVKRVACAVGRANEVVPIIHRHLDGGAGGSFFACYLDE